MHKPQSSLPRNSHPNLTCQESQHRKGKHLFRAVPQARGRAARHPTTSWVPAAQCSSNPASTIEKSLASSICNRDALPRGYGPKNPHCGSQDHGMGHKKVIV